MKNYVFLILFLTVDSDFEAGIYSSEFRLFKNEGEYFTKSQEIIKQFLHSSEEIKKHSGLKLISQDDVYLYTEELADKAFLVFQKV